MDQCCPTNTCNVMEMLPFFLDIPMEAPSVHVPPSRILSELQMPMQKRFEQLTKSTRKRRNVTEFNTFTKNPDIVVFQNFEEYQSYKTTLTFVNTKTISKNLKLHLDRKSPYFDFVLPSHDLDFAKVAPGIAYVVTILFNPARMRDYVAQLICETNEETIVVPIYGLGQRPLFQISDEIKLSSTAVRVTSEKSVLVHNLGVQSGHYRVSVEEPFAVVPKRSILEPNQANELKISCTPITGENPKSNVVIICADIELRIPITCEVEEAQISLNKQSIEFFEVYVGLQDYKTLTVHNKSPFTVDFRWKMLPNEEDDLLKLKTLIANMGNLAENEKQKYTKLEYNDIVSRHGHKRIINYKLREQAENLNEEFKLMYVSEAFNIIPLEGKILPNQPFDFNIIFAPSNNDVYMSSAYLDVTGRHERFHLYLSGIGRGPCIVFNVNKLNTGTIFLEAIHEYQVVVRNEGCIPATVAFQEKKTEFGGHIGCKPDFQRLKRIDSCKTFIVSFSSSIQGPFIEKVYFKIKESNEIIYFLLIGNVVCPLLKPDIDKLDFGKRAFGTEITKQVVLSNNSQVPIDFYIIMSKINYSDMIMEGKTEKKADFTYQPEKGVVGPFENVTIEVKLLTNVIDDVKETMIIKMYGTDLYKIEIPCSYTCLIPTITCEPQDIYITFCFLNFVYKRTLTFTNTTSLTGQLKYTPLEEPPNMQLTLSPTEIYITPRGVFEVELTITTDVLGLHEYPLMFTLVGQENPTRWCNLKCNGQGPVISYFPDEIHFGKVQLLIKKVRKMSFVNDSPIKAKIFLSTNDKSVLQLPIEEFELYPECEMNVDVVCFLTEDGKFDCQIFVDIENGENIVIHVSGEGIGYPIECVPNLEPIYDLGNQLTYINNKLHISISNLGKKYYKIYWSRKQVIKNPKELVDEAENPPLKSAFTFEPNYLELGENCTEEIDLIACSRMPHYVEENFYMQATIDGMGKSVINIMSVLLKVKFCVPNMSFSTNQLNFMEMHVPTEGDPLCTLDDVEIPLVSQASGEVTVKNEVEIPLDLMIRTSVGFFIKLEDDMLVESYSHILEVGKELMIHIEFKPLNESKRYIKQLGKLTVNIPEYPKTESVFLTGELCYPSVQFLPPEMNFGCLAFGSSSCKNIIIQNITFLPVKFSLELLMDSFEIVKLPSTKDGSYTSIYDVIGGISEGVVKADVYKEKQSAILPVSARATVLVVKSEEERAEEKRTEEEQETEETEAESKKEEEVFAFHPKRSSKSGSKKSQERQKSAEVQVGLEEIPEKLEEGSVDESLRKGSMKRSLNSLHKGAEEADPSEQFLTKTSYTSQDLLLQASDPLKIMKAAKDLLNNLLYYKHEEPDRTEIKSRDFWTEMKQNDGGPEETLRNIITLEPWEGCLKPYEYGLLNISFNPPPNISVQCTAVCKIEGGEQEPIKITGSCSNIAFSFDKTSLDVGRKLFCEVFETSITLKNDGYYEFPVKVRCDPEQIFSNKQIKPQWLNIFPQKYYLEAGKSITFEIRYFPGLTGPFEEDLVFELDFLDPITIPLKGYAVFSQVVLSIPRRDLNKRYRHIPYIGIATITDSLLLNKLNVGALRKPSFTSIANSYMLEDRTNAKFKQLAEEDWQVIFRDDLMPSIQELDLALERTMLNDHLAYHYEDLKRHSITKKFKIIPDFKVPPYKLNFGNVTVETPVCFTVRITNVGPEPACVKLVKNNTSSHQSNDMTIEFKQKVLDVGEAAHLHVILKPTLKSALDYDDRCIRDILYLEVTHGATIPILVTATLALPRFNFTRKCIDFGMVKIGNAFKQTVLIENKGCLTCFWETEVRSLNNMKPLYHVIPNRGELDAFDKGIMNIYFVPEKKGFYNAEVVVHVMGSPKEVKLKLCGDGVQPTLVFKEPNVKFPPCIPYTTNNVKELLIQNVSTYPIEFCFTDFEDCYDEEKMLIDLFLYFHNLKTVFIPERQLGAGIPDVFINTYQMLESELRKIIKNTQSEDEAEVDSLAGYTKEQIVELICKYYTSFNMPPFPENTTDIFPLEDKDIEGLAVIDEPKQDGQSQKKGVVLIFHGGPQTEYLRTAFKSSKELKLELTSVDKLIIEQLVESRSTVSMIMNNVIDEALTMYEEEPEVSEFDDEYDKLMKKIEILMTCSPTGKKKVAQKESTVASDKGSSKTDTRKSSMTLINVPIKGKNKGKKGAGELFLDFSLEIFAELLKPKFERFREAVMSTAATRFLPHTCRNQCVREKGPTFQ